MNNRRRRVTYRPNKVNSVISGVVGGIFVLIGLTVVIPSAGLFANLYQAFGAKYIGPQIEIEDEPDGGDAQARLEQLRELYEKNLISREEYEEKRREILKEL